MSDYGPAPMGGAPAQKPMFNFCLLVILPILIVLTILIMFLTYLFFWNASNDVSENDKAISDSDTLIKVMVMQAEGGEYYEVFMLQDTSEYIAFCMSEEHLDEIPCMGGSYYPIAYWYGPSQTMDLSQALCVTMVDYYADNIEFLSRIEVYDFSAYKGHTQPMGRGWGIAVAFFWLAELIIAAFFIFVDLIAGLIVFLINRDRKKVFYRKV